MTGTHPPCGQPARAGDEQILLVRPDHLGDLLLTTPALHALRLGFPRARLSILVGSWSAPLLRGNPDPDEVIVCDLPWLARGRPASWGAVKGKLADLRKRHFDRVVSFRVAAKCALFSRLCGGAERWGFDVRKSRWAWTHTVSYRRDRHVVDSYLDLVCALGARRTPPTFQLFPEVADLGPVRDFTADAPAAVVLGVTAGHPSKRWPLERWAAVGDHVAAAGFRVLVNGAPCEAAQVEGVRSHMGYASESLVGRFDLLQFAGLLQRCSCLITLDSFPVHLAAALGVPVVALFGATSSRQWGPYPGAAPSIVVEPAAGVRRSSRAMQQVSVRQVVQAFDLLRGRCRDT